ncbi:hypothetical protein THRCLA_01173 [Thraustotheca clavata]|uniref:PH domain-containing protein n=1 Tax=Thraustotheca clavata TaxID=74557 RepID=A0A1W0A9E0_9STRA|nr:hypothetical protein THRCLA_01173 [Thraustotheca clavata]
MEGLLLHLDGRNEAIGDIRYVVQIFNASGASLLDSMELENYMPTTQPLSLKVSTAPNQFCINLLQRNKVRKSLRFAAPSQESLYQWQKAIFEWRRTVFDRSPTTMDDMVKQLESLLELVQLYEIQPRKRKSFLHRISIASFKALIRRTRKIAQAA